MEFKHVTVLLNETVDGLNIKPDGIYVDGTVGGAGHSHLIAERLSDKGRLICIDQDGEALKAAADRLAEFGDKVTLVRSNYREMARVINDLGIEKVDGIILDLGVSSYQLDNLERGFSYKSDAPLDMRMDTRSSFSAYDVVNNYEYKELVRILREYGEERFAPQIARAIVKERDLSPITTTGRLSDIIKKTVPAKFQKNGHPAKKTFQAIRIEVNKELEVLEDAIDEMIECLNDKGRICIITFHSLEDRIVKNRFKTNENPCTCPPDFPVCVCGKKPKGKVVTRKPILPSEEEMRENKRSKSAKLRIFERNAN